MRMHTCLHLLCAVVPGAVTGGQVSDGRGRLDFDVPGASLDRDAIAARLNELIAAGHGVTPRWIGDDELAARPELVRTMSVKPPTGAGRVRLIQVAGPRAWSICSLAAARISATPPRSARSRSRRSKQGPAEPARYRHFRVGRKSAAHSAIAGVAADYASLIRPTY